MTLSTWLYVLLWLSAPRLLSSHTTLKSHNSLKHTVPQAVCKLAMLMQPAIEQPNSQRNFCQSARGCCCPYSKGHAYFTFSQHPCAITFC